jgi:beta-lactamase regulating signal transducer with metallopeptidase domain
MKQSLLICKYDSKDISEVIKRNNLVNKVSIVKSDKMLAFCLGIKNPKIYISTKTIQNMTKKQIEAILIHEKYHLEHSDSLTLFIGSLPHLLFPFFPLLPKLVERYKIERELEADKQAVRKLGNIQMIGVLRKFIETSPVSPSYVYSVSDPSTIEARIESLLDKKITYPKVRKLDILISAASLLVVLATIVTPVHALEVHSSNQDAMIVCVEEGNCSNSCKSNLLRVSTDKASHPFSSR